MELKTLKDIEKCGIVPCNGNLHQKSVTSRELKAEAVKWVKYTDENCMCMLRQDFMMFFNLTDEDLK